MPMFPSDSVSLMSGALQNPFMAMPQAGTFGGGTPMQTGVTTSLKTPITSGMTGSGQPPNVGTGTFGARTPVTAPPRPTAQNTLAAFDNPLSSPNPFLRHPLYRGF